jgi:hypothetical protein
MEIKEKERLDDKKQIKIQKNETDEDFGRKGKKVRKKKERKIILYTLQI